MNPWSTAEARERSLVSWYLLNGLIYLAIVNVVDVAWLYWPWRDGQYTGPAWFEPLDVARLLAGEGLLLTFPFQLFIQIIPVMILTALLAIPRAWHWVVFRIVASAVMCLPLLLLGRSFDWFLLANQFIYSQVMLIPQRGRQWAEWVKLWRQVSAASPPRSNAAAEGWIGAFVPDPDPSQGPRNAAPPQGPACRSVARRGGAASRGSETGEANPASANDG